MHPSSLFFTNGSSAAAKSLQSCPTLWPHRRQPTRLPRPWDSPGKTTGVGCYFLLQCMKVKSESEVTQSYPTLSDPMNCSPPGSSVHGIFQARVLEWGAIAFSTKFPDQGSNPDSMHWRHRVLTTGPPGKYCTWIFNSERMPLETVVKTKVNVIVSHC